MSYRLKSPKLLIHIEDRVDASRNVDRRQTAQIYVLCPRFEMRRLDLRCEKVDLVILDAAGHSLFIKKSLQMKTL